MSGFASYLVHERGFTSKSAEDYAERITTVERVLEYSIDARDEATAERQFRQRAKGSLSPTLISNCVSAMRAYEVYASRPR